MSSLFRPKTPAPPPPLPEPRAVRMPTETDPSVLAAGQRTRKAALARKGRLSTILTDTLAGGGMGAGNYDTQRLGGG